MPQMMPIYWFLICLLVNMFIHFFFSFYYHNFLFFSKYRHLCGKVSSVKELKFLK